MILKKENGELYYEVSGEGAPLLLIHGVIVDAGLYEQTAKILSRYYKVICYDRSGYSRSKCKKNQKFSMKEQAEDILAILDVLKLEKVIVVGASAGAVIGQYFLQNHPKKVEYLIMYEPAMLGCMMLEDSGFRTWAEETKELIQKRKYNMALLRFAEHIGFQDLRSPQKTEEVSLRELSNVEYAFTEEIPALLNYYPDMDRMRLLSDKITIAVGEKSGDTAYVMAAGRLAEQIGKKVIYYPGGHNLPYDLPIEYAVCLIGTLVVMNVHEKMISSKIL